MNEKKGFTQKLLDFFFSGNLKYTLVSIFFGLLVGAVILAFTGFNPFNVYWIILKGIFGKASYISYTIIYATPLIITGLSIAFAFRTGLFNIGAEGQFIIGALAATLVGYFIKLPLLLHIPIVIIIAVCAAALWGGLAGFLKAKYGIHEVISTIMLNWIALYLQNFAIMTPGFNKPHSEASYAINPSASIEILGEWKRSDGGINWLIENPFFKDLLRTPLNLGIIFAILLALAVWIILKKTTLGYELRAVGFNKDAAEYGGINIKKSMIISMMIAGGIAGFAGALHVMGVAKNITLLAAMEGYGFDGIAVALIGNTSPLGCVFAGLLFGAFKYGGPKIQAAIGAPSEIISIIIGTIVFFVAIPKLIKILLTKLHMERGK